MQATNAISKPRQEWSPPKLSDREMEEEMEDGLEASDIAGIFENDKDSLKMCHKGAGYGRKLTPSQLKQATINGTIPTIIANTGALSTCVIPNDEQLQVSECGI